MGEIVSARLPEKLVEDLDALAASMEKSRSETLRKVLERGLAAERLETSLEAYRKGEVSIGRAAAISGRPITVFLEELRRAGILLNYTTEDLEEDLAWVEDQR